MTKTKVPKLTENVGYFLKKMSDANASLRRIKYTTLPKRIPNFYIWYDGYFRPPSMSPTKPLFIGIAYTQTKRGEEDVKMVILDNDGTLQIRPTRRDGNGWQVEDNPYSKNGTLP